MRGSLRTKLILAIGVPLLAIYLAVLVVDYTMSRRDAIRNMEQLAVSVASHQAELINGRLISMEQISHSNADFLAMLPLDDPDEVDRFLTSTVLRDPDVYGSCAAMAPVPDEMETTGDGSAEGQQKRWAPFACRYLADRPALVSRSSEGERLPGAESVGSVTTFPQSSGAPEGGEKNGNGKSGNGDAENRMGDGSEDGARTEPGNAGHDETGSDASVDVPEMEPQQLAIEHPIRVSELKYLDIAKQYDYTRWDWYLLPTLLNRPVWTDPYYDDGAGDALICTFASPFYRNRRLAGVTTVDISLEWLKDQLAAQAPEGGYLFLVGPSGTIISHPDSRFIMTESIFSRAAWMENDALERLGYRMIAGEHGVERVNHGNEGFFWYAYVPVHSAGWSLAVVMDEKLVLEDVYHRLQQQFGILLCGLLVILGLVAMVSHWMTDPIRRLAVAAERVAGGDLSTQVTGSHRRDEMGRFTETFNRMVTDLRISVDQRITESTAREAVERELQVARRIQLSLLPMQRPPFPDHPEFDLYADNMAAKFIAGDFFDFWFLNDDLLAVVVADVSGKGVPAAMYMAVTRTLLRNLATADETPGRTVERVNDALTREDHAGMFVTIFFAHYHVGTGRIVYANAAHSLAFIVRNLTGEEPDPSVRCAGGNGTAPSGVGFGMTAGPEGESTGTMCGVFENEEYGVLETVLAPGEKMVLYTDGVTEANHLESVMDENGETREVCRMFGETRLAKLLTRIGGRPVDEITNSVIHAADDFRHHEAQDDITVLVLKRNA